MSALVPEYVRRSREEEDPRIKRNWQKCAISVIDGSDEELKILQEEIERSPDMHSPSYLQQIERRRDEISQIQADLDRENPFRFSVPK